MSDQEEGQDMVEVLVEGIDEIPQEAAVEVEEGEFKGLDREGLIKRIQESETRAKEALNNANVFSGAVDRLGEKLAKNRESAESLRPAEPAVPPPLSSDQLKEKLEKDLLERPKEALDAYLQATFGPVVQNIATNNMSTFRKLTRMEKGVEAFDKYAAQIDSWVRARPPYEQMQSDIYEKAYASVMMQNIDSVVEEKAMAIAKKMLEQQRQEEVQQPSRPVMYTERGGSAPPQPPTAKVKRVVLSEAEKKDADARGMEYVDYARVFKGVPW